MRLGARGVALCASLVAASPCLAAVRGEVSPALAETSTGATLRVAVDVDLTGSGRTLGGYGAALAWDPGQLQYLGHAGGEKAPFDSPVVNDGAVAGGLLRFSDAAPQGAAGRVNVLNVTFRVVALPCSRAAIDVEFTSLYAAQTFEDLQGVLVVRDGAADVTDFFFALEVMGTSQTILQWNPVPGALRYDAIRGDLRQIFADATLVHLGVVTCIENDSLDATTGSGTEPAHPDGAVPGPGGGFFYLVRTQGGTGPGGYGFTAACARQRLADSGDCP